MFAPPPLLDRLRRRSHGARWLFALLILLKLAVGTACLASDVATSAPSVAEVPTVVATAFVSDDAACWHAGAGGCHCNCAHATPLPGAAWSDLPRLAPVQDFVAAPSAWRLPPARDPLRPPIA